MPCGETDENHLELKKVQSVFASVDKPIDREKLETLGLIVHMPGKKYFPMGESYSLPGKNTVINIFLMPVSVAQDLEGQTNQIS